jgi:predicted phosphodiesterase
MPATRYDYKLQSGDKQALLSPRSPLRFRTLEPPPGDPLFSFATINDSHVGENVAGLLCLGDTCFSEGFETPWPEHPYWRFTNETVVEAINRKGPDFVIHKGDLTSTYRQEEFLEAKRIFDRLRMPYHVLRGNHDRRGKPGERDEDYFQLVFDLDPTYRHFLYKDHLFVLLDSNNLETGLPEISQEQFAWLEEVLAAYPDKRLLVFLHHAVTRDAQAFGLPAEDRGRLIGMLSKHPGLAGVFSGHSHRACVTHAGQTGDVPYVETPSTKEYPGGFCLYRMYTGGYMQSFYRASGPYCLPWYERTKGEYWGLAPLILFGRLEDRNFVYRYRT